MRSRQVEAPSQGEVEVAQKGLVAVVLVLVMSVSIRHDACPLVCTYHSC